MAGSTAKHKERLFVYGTLLHGQANGGYLSGQPRKAASLGGQLWMAPAGYPALVVEEGKGPVSGELVEIDREHLLVLDVLEGVDRGLYARTTHPVAVGNAVVPAFVYTVTAEQVRTRKYRLLKARDWRRLQR